MPPRRIPTIICAALLASIGPVSPGWTQDAELPDIELFDPLVTRNPMPERELEVGVNFERNREGREIETSAELSWRFGRRLEVSLEVPVVTLLPRQGSSVSGLGDISMTAKFLAFESVEHAALLSVGFELGLPTGSERRGLGGSTTATPFITAGKGFGPIDLIGEVNYTWTAGGADSRVQAFQINLAAAYKGWRRVTPSLELNLVTQTRSAKRRGVEADDEDAPVEPSLVGRPQVYLTPGIAVSGLPWMPRGTSLRGGVQIPVTNRKEFDYRILTIFNWEF